MFIPPPPFRGESSGLLSGAKEIKRNRRNKCKSNCSNFQPELKFPRFLPPVHLRVLPTLSVPAAKQMQISIIQPIMHILYGNLCFHLHKKQRSKAKQQPTAPSLVSSGKLVDSLVCLSPQVSHPFACQKPTCHKCCTKFPQQEVAGSKPAGATSPSVTPSTLRGDGAVAPPPSNPVQPVVTQGSETHTSMVFKR